MARIAIDAKLTRVAADPLAAARRSTKGRETLESLAEDGTRSSGARDGVPGPALAWIGHSTLRPRGAARDGAELVRMLRASSLF
jgi:hypothetical protein